MKQKRMLLSALLALGAIHTQAAITIPGADGSDGELVITADTVIDLSQAATANWNASYADLDAADPTRTLADFVGKGVYDPNKWAVVFRYSNVSIAAGATVTFKNHPSRAPVVWLVSGNATIMGSVSLDGQGRLGAPWLAEPGPGGFRGGTATYSPTVGASSGFGVGGGGQSFDTQGFGGGYGGPGDGNPSIYGNPSLIPLIGGSGGAGVRGLSYAGGGGAGGGAILIAVANTLQINGEIRANGGLSRNAYPGDGWRSGSGSGGGIRILANQLLGTGTIRAVGDVTEGDWGLGHPGGVGRIRIERVVNDNTLVLIPDPSVVPLPNETTGLLWPPSGSPEVKIISIGDIADTVAKVVPTDPRSEFGAVGADVVLPELPNAKVVVETRNVETASRVKVRINPRVNGPFSEIEATLSETVSTDPDLVLRWTAVVPAKIGYSVVQARVIRP